MHKFTVYLGDTKVEVVADSMEFYSGAVQFFKSPKPKTADEEYLQGIHLGTGNILSTDDTVGIVSSEFVAYRDDCDIKVSTLEGEQLIPELKAETDK